MTDRKPDFYRVVRIYNGSREYMARLGTWASQPCFASLFSTIEQARHHVLRGERVVPVYVKVTRKPRTHDFAWALRRMREGKRVRQRAWLNPKRFWEIARANTKYETIMTNGGGESNDGTTRWGIEADGSDLLATDWELAP